KVLSGRSGSRPRTVTSPARELTTTTTPPVPTVAMSSGSGGSATRRTIRPLGRSTTRRRFWVSSVTRAWGEDRWRGRAVGAAWGAEVVLVAVGYVLGGVECLPPQPAR